MMPLPWLLIGKIVAAAAVVGALLWGWHRFTEHYRDQGRAEVQAAWDTEKAAQEADRARQEAAWAAQQVEVEKMSHERDKARSERFAALEKLSQLERKIARIRVPSVVADRLQHAVDAANATGPAGTPGEPDKAAAAPAARAEGATDLGLLDDWFRRVAEVHAECRDRVQAWATFYNNLRLAQE